MELTMRWFGPADPVQLWQLRQVPNLSGVVTALHDFAPGEPWTRQAMQDLRQRVEVAGLRLSVIESIPVHEDIKLGNERCGERIEAWTESLRVVADAGVRTVCYNFMPVFDWTRTDLAHPRPDGSTSLIFRQAEVEQLRIGVGELSLPGWAEAYTPAELADLRAAYQGVDAAALRQNLASFLRAVVPEAARLGVKLAIHPDDPPWPVLGLPRVVSTAEDLRFILDAVPDEHNGLTFCLGSLGARPDNDLRAMVEAFAPRIHFVHARNVRRHSDRDFDEVPHVSRFGSTDLAAVIMRLEELRPDVPVRPDHGRMIWGETGRPGYGLYDRALGAMYLQGLIDAVQERRSHA
ncbi:mannonate dehydratase (plasmid) [Deinococcus metallilatus]|uniref:Mannonate dehydratase n=1 Tax=Deinococcus metallilatus TaxID=1211322 RepID=A0ABR6MYD1_9DEIO|nr:mannonate dehydratase [Deinococcus metallilatus]MBB5296942.1 mannonate dehydratase [Deinococcus metallilatus]QBY06690.1 mannonate dehydratase [Deinococcus metallilatus]GMA15159.1 mannonate dehydratase [Deinococcus metallilatus]